jgi:uncharacterized protein YciI
VAHEDSHHILFYEYGGESVVERRAPHREAHLARVREAREAGGLVMAGAIGDPPNGAVLVFRGVEPSEIEAFVADDPYVEAGLVTSWRVEPWKLV